VDVGTLNGYREAMRVLGKQNDDHISISFLTGLTGLSGLQDR